MAATVFPVMEASASPGMTGEGRPSTAYGTVPDAAFPPARTSKKESP